MPRILNHPDAELGAEVNEIDTSVLSVQEQSIWQVLRILDILSTAPATEGGPRVRAGEDSKKLRALQSMARTMISSQRDYLVGTARLLSNLRVSFRRDREVELRAGGRLTKMSQR